MDRDSSDYRSMIYSSFISKSFGKATRTDEFTLRQFRNIYRANHGMFLPKKKDAAILDLGCGMGHFLDFLVHENYTNIYGFDPSEEAASYCAERFEADIICKADPLAFLKDSAGKFDAVVFNNVVEHLKKEEVFPYLEAIRGALKPGGVLILSTPNMASITACYMRYVTLTHEVGFTEFALKVALEVAGFERVSVLGERLPGAGPGRLLRKIARRAVHFMLRTAYRAEQAHVPRILSASLLAVAHAPQ